MMQRNLFRMIAFQDLMLDPDPARRVKADFFIELYPVIHDRDVSDFDWFDLRSLLDRCFAYQIEPRTIKAVTDFRLVKQHITNARRIKAVRKFSTRLRRFAEEHDVPVSHLEIQEASVHAEAKALTKKIAAVETLVRDFETEQFYGEEELWKAIVSLLETLEKKPKSADKRLGKMNRPSRTRRRTDQRRRFLRAGWPGLQVIEIQLLKAVDRTVA